jgi:hypothetical protein
LIIEKRKGDVDKTTTIVCKVDREGVQRGSYNDNIIIDFSKGLKKVVSVKMSVENKTPSKPVVLPVKNDNSTHNEKEGIITKPTIKWTKSVDPERDNIEYLVYVGTEENPKTLQATIKQKEDIKEYKYKLQNKLEYNTQYFVKVVAKDNLNGTTDSEIIKFKTAVEGKIWHKLHSFDSTISGYTDNRAVVFNNKIWYITGNAGATTNNRIINSSDGKVWNYVGLFNDKRTRFQLLAFKGKLWIIGGRGKSDVYSSTDGKTWKKEVDKAPFGNVERHKCVVFKDKMWVLTGRSKRDAMAWYSTDGIKWTKTSNQPPAIDTHTEVLTHKNELWVVGAFGPTGILKSNDAENWTQVAKLFHMQTQGKKIVSYNGKLWRIGGGYSESGHMGSGVWNKKTLWSSVNGKDWEVATSNMGFSMLGGNAIVINNSLIVIDNKDVWRMD